MKVSLLSGFGVVALLGGVAAAEPWDRGDHEVGRGREQAFRASVSARDAMPQKPIVDVQDTVTKGNIGREFRNKAELMAHMNTATKMRMSANGEADGDGAIPVQASSHKSSNPAVVTAHEARGNEQPYKSTRPDASLHEEQITETSVTGRRLGQDTVVKGQQYRNFRDKADMMAHMTAAVAIRISGEAGQDGSLSGGGSSNAGHSNVSDPTQLTDKQRKQLAAEGLVIGKKQSTADVEDKTM